MYNVIMWTQLKLGSLVKTNITSGSVRDEQSMVPKWLVTSKILHSLWKKTF
jgi:hypothetical protein